MQDTERQEQVVRSSGLDWTLVQPVNLTDGGDDTHTTSTDGRARRMTVSRRGSRPFTRTSSKAAATCARRCPSPDESQPGVPGVERRRLWCEPGGSVAASPGRPPTTSAFRGCGSYATGSRRRTFGVPAARSAARS
ncbi:MAG: NAD(P)H-binding protein [Dermatophilaceae bacterium]